MRRILFWRCWLIVERGRVKGAHQRIAAGAFHQIEEGLRLLLRHPVDQVLKLLHGGHGLSVLREAVVSARTSSQGGNLGGILSESRTTSDDLKALYRAQSDTN